jgi:hypothetical protein
VSNRNSDVQYRTEGEKALKNREYMKNRYLALSLKRKELEEQIDREDHDDKLFYNKDERVIDESKDIMREKVKEIISEQAIIRDETIANDKHIARIVERLGEIDAEYTNLQKTPFAEMMHGAWARRETDTDDRVAFSWRNQMARAGSIGRQAWYDIRHNRRLLGRARREAGDGNPQTTRDAQGGRQWPRAIWRRTQISPIGLTLASWGDNIGRIRPFSRFRSEDRSERITADADVTDADADVERRTARGRDLVTVKVAPAEGEFNRQMPFGEAEETISPRRTFGENAGNYKFQEYLETEDVRVPSTSGQNPPITGSYGDQRTRLDGKASMLAELQEWRNRMDDNERFRNSNYSGESVRKKLQTGLFNTGVRTWRQGANRGGPQTCTVQLLGHDGASRLGKVGGEVDPSMNFLIGYSPWKRQQDTSTVQKKTRLRSSWVRIR